MAKPVTPVGFFAYRWQAPAAAPISEIAVLFRVPGYSGATELADLFETVCLGPYVPDAVVLVELDIERGAATLRELFQTEFVRQAMSRISAKVSVVGARLRSNSLATDLQLLSEKHLESDVLLRALQQAQEQWVVAGLAAVFAVNRVVIRAPSGYAFLKPSKQRSSVFLRAEQGLLTSAEVFYVAACIWRYFLRYRTFVAADITHIFIDTIGIAPVAFALREIFRRRQKEKLPLIESFHSYEGMENVRTPLPGQSICLISASTSMGMHRDWVRVHRVSESEVLTLVTLSDAKDRDKALCQLPAGEVSPDNRTSAKFDIRIEGETFVPAPEPIRQVVLGKVHKSDLIQPFWRMRDERIFDIYRRDDAPSPRMRPLYVDGRRLVGTPLFKSWLKLGLDQYAKGSTRVVAHLGDAGSQAMAERVATHLAKRVGKKPLILQLTNARWAKQMASFANDGLVVCASVVARGGELLNLSRNLRGLHFGPRLFIVGFQVVDTPAQLSMLVSNLTQLKHRAAVDMLRFGEAAIGGGIGDSFAAELEFLKKVVASGQSAPSVLKSRFEYLSSPNRRRADSCLLPYGTNLKEKLALRKDFFFWPDEYVPGPYQPEVIASISALLERVRTPKAFEEPYSLHSAVLRQVALSPENFTRYDDGLIQGAILRCALRSELDYRDSVESSRFVRQFMLRALENISSDRSESVLEFMVSLKSGRLLLRPSDAEEIFTKVNQLDGKSELEAVVKYIASFDIQGSGMPI